MKRDHTRIFGWLGAALLGLGSFAPLWAQDQDDLRRGVARISLINGDVSVRRGDTGEWVAAAVNAPLMTEDRVATGPNSRVEIEFDAANVLRAGGNSEVRMAQLEYGKYQLEVARGTVNFSVLRPSTDNVEVDTPSVSVKPSKQGVYRISVSEDGETQVSARAGEVEVFTPRGSQWVASGQMLMARGAAADAEFQVVAANPLDEWDRWNQERDRRMTQTTSYQYVPQGVYGVEDLDTYGTWQNTDEYGWAWRPTAVAADWSPYSLGRWAWQDWYGWTWVSSDPWGWAPYHYGRWFHESRYGWCWYPGAFGGGRHYWSPALVAFFGYGRGGVGFGFGNVGWVPLAPHESFNRWWGRGYYNNGGSFNRNMNITNVNITNNYRNARVRNGISGVAEGDFRGGRFGRVSHVSGDQVREAGLIRGQVPIAPNSANLRFSDRGVSQTPRSNDNARFFSRQQSNNRAERVPFAQQQRAIEQTSRAAGQSGRDAGAGNAGAGNAVRGQQQSQPGVAARPDANRNSSGGGWQRFGNSGAPAGGRDVRNTTPRSQSNGWREGAGGAAAQNTRPQTQTPSQSAPARGAWTRFGEPGSRPQGNQVQRPAPESPRSFSPRTDQQIRTAPPVVRERPSQQQYSSPQRAAPQNQPRSFGRPSYSPPARQSQPRSYSPSVQPRASSPAPSYSAPRGGGGSSSPRQSGGGGSSAPRGNSGGGRGGGRR